MKIASSILLILYVFLMCIPLFSKKVKRDTKAFLLICVTAAITHLILFLLGYTKWWVLLLCLLLFQVFSLFQGIRQGEIHWHHQFLRLFVHGIIFIFFLF